MTPHQPAVMAGSREREHPVGSDVMPMPIEEMCFWSGQDSYICTNGTLKTVAYGRVIAQQ